MKNTTTLALGLAILGSSMAATEVNAQSVQERFQNLSQEQQEKGKKRYGFWKTWKQDITKTVTKVDGGVSVTMTTENEAALEKLLEREGRSNDKTTTTVTQLSNGITVTTTSEDPEIVERLQSRADRHLLKSSINKVVENLDNGVKVTITSDNAEAVEKIKSKEQKDSQHEEITKTVNELSNGLEIIITSDNEDMVERIQKRAERGGKKQRGKNFKSFNRNFDKARNATSADQQ